MNSSTRFDYLLNKYISETLSSSEEEELYEFIQNPTNTTKLESHILEQLKNTPLSDHLMMREATSEKIIQNIMAVGGETKPTLSVFDRKFFKYGAAAAVLIGISWAIMNIFFASKGNEINNELIVSIQVHQINNSDTIQTISLEDGSEVKLHPNGSLQYPEKFSDSIREVFLEGNAFFEVASNPSQPFLVHSKNITTRVVGTSFLISIDPSTGIEEVAVKTGRVAVTPSKKMAERELKELTTVILNPNQKAVYEENTQQLLTTLVEHPQMVIVEVPTKESIKPVVFNYEQQKLSKIFSDLEKAYGVTIKMENELLGDCLFTGDLSENDLFIQLRILGLSTNSTYELIGTEILMKGKGCK